VRGSLRRFRCSLEAFCRHHIDEEVAIGGVVQTRALPPNRELPLSCGPTMLVRALVDPLTHLSPIQRLACAVIRQAVLDVRLDKPTGARSAGRAMGMRQRAVYWLRDDDGFRTWCARGGPRSPGSSSRGSFQRHSMSYEISPCNVELSGVPNLHQLRAPCVFASSSRPKASWAGSV
jgi:hypothetical protein